MFPVAGSRIQVSEREVLRLRGEQRQVDEEPRQELEKKCQELEKKYKASEREVLRLRVEQRNVDEGPRQELEKKYQELEKKYKQLEKRNAALEKRVQALTVTEASKVKAEGEGEQTGEDEQKDDEAKDEGLAAAHVELAALPGATGRRLEPADEDHRPQPYPIFLVFALQGSQGCSNFCFKSRPLPQPLPRGPGS